ncbi:hypothetical protein AB0F72_17620 [Actinoplanes sp. NPDC023936]|uniref:hypothetical protein n=1 Tax=Actinoplanes sp. NPDC023936 TaxID=3154910 RepID=UPI0033C87123
MTKSNTSKASKSSGRSTPTTTAAAARIQSTAAKHPTSATARTGFAPRAQRAAAGNARRGATGQ